jgi:hypothetical protein
VTQSRFIAKFLRVSITNWVMLGVASTLMAGCLGLVAVHARHPFIFVSSERQHSWLNIAGYYSLVIPQPILRALSRITAFETTVYAQSCPTCLNTSLQDFGDCTPYYVFIVFGNVCESYGCVTSVGNNCTATTGTLSYPCNVAACSNVTYNGACT